MSSIIPDSTHSAATRIAFLIALAGDDPWQMMEVADLINEATAKIPEKYRIPFLLREVDQLSYEEIQQVTGLKLGTVRSRINRARNRFRQNIKPLLRNETLLADLERIVTSMAAAAKAASGSPMSWRQSKLSTRSPSSSSQ